MKLAVMFAKFYKQSFAYLLVWPLLIFNLGKLEWEFVAKNGRLGSL